MRAPHKQVECVHAWHLAELEVAFAEAIHVAECAGVGLRTHLLSLTS